MPNQVRAGRNIDEFLSESGISKPTDFGFDPLAASFSPVTSQITNEEKLQQDVGETVDIKTGGPAGVRAQLSLQTPSNVDPFLDQSFGENGWRRTKEGNVVFVDKESGKEILLDEAGFSMKDFADAADVAPQVIGSLGAIAAVAATIGTSEVSIPFLALAAAAGGVMTASVSDALQQANISPKVVLEIADKRGFEGVLDFIFGVSSGTVGKLLSTRLAKEKIVDPSVSDIGVSGAVARIEQETGTRIPISVGESTGAPSLQRIESIGEKLPLSSDVFRKQAIERDLAVQSVQKDLIGDSPKGIGQDFSSEFTKRKLVAQSELNELRGRIDENLQSNLNTIGDTLSPSGRGITTSSAGETYRASGELKRDAFLDATKADYELARQLPGGREPIVETSKIAGAAKRIEKSVPQERITEEIEGEIIQTGTAPAKAFIPPKVKSFLGSIQNLDTMTIDQARQGRRLIFDAISESEALPGINTRFLKNIGRQFTESIDDAVTKLPDGRLKKQLLLANKNYKDNFEQYLEPGIVELYRSPTTPGFIEDSKLVENSLNNIDRVKRIKEFVGADSKEWGVFVRSAYNSMIDDSRNILKPNMMDVTKLASRFSRMNPEIQKELFGKQGKNIQETLRKMAANGGDIPVSSIDDLSLGMAQAIRTASLREKAVNKEYNDRVLKPFLKDEVGATEINPDDFVRHVMKASSIDDIDKVFKILGTNNPQRDKFERSVIMDVLDKGTRPASAEDIVQGAISEGDDIISGQALFNTLKSGYGEGSIEKITKVIGKDKVQLLKDLATIQASKEQKAKSAAGGLISGFIISSLARGDLTALPMIAQYRVLSWMMTNKTMSKVLSSKKVPIKATQGGTSKIASIMTGPMINDLSNFVGPSDQAAVMDFFGIPAESRPKRENVDRFLEIELNDKGLTENPDIRLRTQ